MQLNRYQFDVLSYIEEHGAKEYPWRELVDSLHISGTQVLQVLKFLKNNGMIAATNQTLCITKEGIEALEPYRVKSVVIFAAGFGSRMVPVTLDTPKPLVKVNGVRIIDRMLDAFLAKGITDITIVRGYLKEKFDVLLDKYPMLHLVDNDKYEKENNISSALLVLDKIDSCYICAGDLMLSNPDVIKRYHYCSNYLASYALETDDWCFDFDKGFARNYRKGGQYCFNQYEVTYWNSEDCKKLCRHWQEAYKTEGGYDLFWEFIPLVLYRNEYNVEINICDKSDIIEIDNFYELVELDSSYQDYSKE